MQRYSDPRKGEEWKERTDATDRWMDGGGNSIFIWKSGQGGKEGRKGPMPKDLKNIFPSTGRPDRMSHRKLSETKQQLR